MADDQRCPNCAPGYDCEQGVYTPEAAAVADFYEPGVTYVNAKFPVPGWRFRCDVITTHPEDGERTALGWRLWRDRWEPIAYGEDDWSVDYLVACERPTRGRS